MVFPINDYNYTNLTLNWQIQGVCIIFPLFIKLYVKKPMFLSGWVDGAGGGLGGDGVGGVVGGLAKTLTPDEIWGISIKQVSVYCTRINEYWQK